MREELGAPKIVDRSIFEARSRPFFARSSIIMPASLRSDCCSLSLRNRCSPSPEYPPESLRSVSEPTIAFRWLTCHRWPCIESRCLRHYFTFVQWYLTVICEGPCGLRRVP